MSNRRLRPIERLDYKTFSDKGEVLRREPEGFRKMAKLVDQELKIVGKIDRFLLENDLSLMVDELDIKEAITELKILTESYVDVHIDLKNDLKEDYAQTYPGYDDQIKRMVDYTRSAKQEIKSKRDNTKDLEVEKIRDKLRAEEIFFRDTIVREVDMWEKLDSEFLQDLDQYSISAQDLITGYTDIFIRIKELGVDFHGEFGDEFEKQIQKLRDFIYRTRNKIKRIRTTEIQTKEEHDILIQNEKYENEKREKTAFCKTIYENLCTRMSNLEARCAEVSELNDAQVLDAKKDLRTIDSDFNDILDRSTKLCKASSVDIKETYDMVTQIDERKQAVLKTIESFKKDLDEEIVSRDLSYEKLKNASLLGIKLSKFSGYDSTTDFYTFKTDFEKLVTPRVQAKLLPDILKNNYLDGQALKLVKEIEDLDKIWERLKLSFGNVVTLMSKKLGEFECETPLYKVKGDENIVESIVKMKNCMLVLSSLAEKHEIEQNLFHTSNIVKVFNLLGKKRQIDLTETFVASEMSDKEKWTEMINYLDNELKVKEQLILFEKSSVDTSKVKPDNPGPKSGSGKAFLNNYDRTKCLICGKSDHVAMISNKGKTIINYIACEIFASMTCKERFECLKKQNLCFQCLTPGLKAGHAGHCFDKYKCPHESHNDHKTGLHVLICDQHKSDEANLRVLEDYKEKCITGSTATYEEFSKNIQIFYCDQSPIFTTENESLHDDESDKAIFMTQRIRVGDRDLNLFYDSGCGDMVCRKESVDHLSMLGKAVNIQKGPLILTGVGDNKSVCKHGRFSVTIPKFDGSDAKFSGICLDIVTGKLPTIPLKGIEKDIRDSYAVRGGDVKKLPRLQESVGGETDLMIGIQYLKYFPREVYKFPNGLSIYESQFLSSDGTRGIVAGPHKRVTEIFKELGCCNMSMSAYFSDLLHAYRNAYKIEQCTSLLEFEGYSEHKNEDEFQICESFEKIGCRKGLDSDDSNVFSEIFENVNDESTHAKSMYGNVPKCEIGFDNSKEFSIGNKYDESIDEKFVDENGPDYESTGNVPECEIGFYDSNEFSIENKYDESVNEKSIDEIVPDFETTGNVPEGDKVLNDKTLNKNALDFKIIFKLGGFVLVIVTVLLTFYCSLQLGNVSTTNAIDVIMYKEIDSCLYAIESTYVKKHGSLVLRSYDSEINKLFDAISTTQFSVLFGEGLCVSNLTFWEERLCFDYVLFQIDSWTPIKNGLRKLIAYLASVFPKCNIHNSDLDNVIAVKLSEKFSDKTCKTSELYASNA